MLAAPRSRLSLLRIPFLAAVRPAQFATIGGVCAVAQLLLLALLQERTGLGAWSNALAFLVAAQINFVLNYAVTWRDRMTPGVLVLARRLAGFNVLVAIGLPLNQGAYLLAEMVVPYIIAGAVGIGATTLAKYLIADRWIFPKRTVTAP
ncbi:MAG: GtrA family protein [Dehalococcoidia bacterium]